MDYLIFPVSRLRFASVAASRLTSRAAGRPADVGSFPARLGSAGRRRRLGLRLRERPE